MFRDEWGTHWLEECEMRVAVNTIERQGQVVDSHSG